MLIYNMLNFPPLSTILSNNQKNIMMISHFEAPRFVSEAVLGPEIVFMGKTTITLQIILNILVNIVESPRPLCQFWTCISCNTCAMGVW